MILGSRTNSTDSSSERAYPPKQLTQVCFLINEGIFEKLKILCQNSFGFSFKIFYFEWIMSHFRYKKSLFQSNKCLVLNTKLLFENHIFKINIQF